MKVWILKLQKSGLFRESIDSSLKVSGFLQFESLHRLKNYCFKILLSLFIAILSLYLIFFTAICVIAFIDTFSSIAAYL
jgi:hypothetical protein